MPRRIAPRLAVALLALLVAAFAAGCAPSGHSVVLLNDTGDVVVVHPIAVQSQKSFTLQPNETLVPRLTNDTVGLRLTRVDGTPLGCLRPTRQTSRSFVITPGDAERVSQAHGACPAEGLIDFLRGFSRLALVYPLLPLVLGPLGAAVWLFVWARRRPRRTRLIAALESVCLCGLSVVTMLLLVRWGGP